MTAPSPLSNGTDAIEGFSPSPFSEFDLPISVIPTDLNINCNEPTSSPNGQRTFYSPFAGYNKLHLPPYITPVDHEISVEDVVLLIAAEAFTLPNVTVRDELVRKYAEYVHPFLPLINLDEFLAAIVDSKACSTVSLLLFQAIMFVATAYISKQTLATLGYSSRRAAEEAFFRRVKVLFDSDFERDRITIVQSVLLMSYRYENVEISKDSWYWSGIAVSVASTIGLGDWTNMSRLDSKTQKLWKRIWWSCFIQDRLVAVSMRRPLRIMVDEFDLPMLELDDFATCTISTANAKALEICPWLNNSSMRLALAEMCISLAKLCYCIGRILTLQYSLMSHNTTTRRETTMSLMPKGLTVDIFEVIRCDEDLERWRRGLPQGLRLFDCDAPEQIPYMTDAPIILHRAFLKGLYSTAISFLHRPQLMISAPMATMPPQLKELSQRKVSTAADDVTETFKGLYTQGMIRYLPSAAVAILLSAAITHLVEIEQSSSTVQIATTRNFVLCLKILYHLRDFHTAAEFGFELLDAAVNRFAAQRYAGCDKPNLTGYSSLLRHGSVQQEESKCDRHKPVHTASGTLSQPSLASSDLNPAGAIHPPVSHRDPTVNAEQMENSPTADRQFLECSMAEAQNTENMNGGTREPKFEAAQDEFQTFWGLGDAFANTNKHLEHAFDAPAEDDAECTALSSQSTPVVER